MLTNEAPMRPQDVVKNPVPMVKHPPTLEMLQIIMECMNYLKNTMGAVMDGLEDGLEHPDDMVIKDAPLAMNMMAAQDYAKMLCNMADHLRGMLE